MNFHVLFSDRAVKEAYKRMLPSKNLLQDTDFKSAEPRLISEQAGGTFLASLEPLKDVPTKHFATLEEAKKAYRRGDISMRDPITIGR
ncbi:hypothetical protein FACS1894170_08970 [Planctomycetales bacterium]|nr:hypothetical protein FACS1894170_08970 [Planctomycetales bacterium]